MGSFCSRQGARVHQSPGQPDWTLTEPYNDGNRQTAVAGLEQQRTLQQEVLLRAQIASLEQQLKRAEQQSSEQQAELLAQLQQATELRSEALSQGYAAQRELHRLALAKFPPGQHLLPPEPLPPPQHLRFLTPDALRQQLHTARQREQYLRLQLIHSERHVRALQWELHQIRSGGGKVPFDPLAPAPVVTKGAGLQEAYSTAMLQAQLHSGQRRERMLEDELRVAQEREEELLAEVGDLEEEVLELRRARGRGGQRQSHTDEKRRQSDVVEVKGVNFVKADGGVLYAPAKIYRVRQQDSGAAGTGGGEVVAPLEFLQLQPEEPELESHQVMRPLPHEAAVPHHCMAMAKTRHGARCRRRPGTMVVASGVDGVFYLCNQNHVGIFDKAGIKVESYSRL